MKWTEPDYLLLQELNDMEDRVLAKKIELCSFPIGPDGRHWDKFVACLMASESLEEFVELAEALILKLGAKFSQSESLEAEALEAVRERIIAEGGLAPHVPVNGVCLILLNGPHVASQL